MNGIPVGLRSIPLGGNVGTKDLIVLLVFLHDLRGGRGPTCTFNSSLCGVVA